MAKMSIGFLRRLDRGGNFSAAAPLAAVTATTVANSPPGGGAVAAQDWTVGRTPPEEEAGNRSGGEEDLAEVNAELREELTILQDKIAKLRSADCAYCDVSLGDNLDRVGL
jgi:hypothetical protein